MNRYIQFANCRVREDNYHRVFNYVSRRVPCLTHEIAKRIIESAVPDAPPVIAYGIGVTIYPDGEGGWIARLFSDVIRDDPGPQVNAPSFPGYRIIGYRVPDQGSLFDQLNLLP